MLSLQAKEKLCDVLIYYVKNILQNFGKCKFKFYFKSKELGWFTFVIQ